MKDEKNAILIPTIAIDNSDSIMCKDTGNCRKA